MNNAFVIGEKKGLFPWLLRKFDRKTNIEVYLTIENKAILENGISKHCAPIGSIVPFYFDDIEFVFNSDNAKYKIIKYTMPDKAVYN